MTKTVILAILFAIPIIYLSASSIRQASNDSHNRKEWARMEEAKKEGRGGEFSFKPGVIGEPSFVNPDGTPVKVVCSACQKGQPKVPYAIGMRSDGWIAGCAVDPYSAHVPNDRSQS